MKQYYTSYLLCVKRVKTFYFFYTTVYCCLYCQLIAYIVLSKYQLKVYNLHLKY